MGGGGTMGDEDPGAHSRGSRSSDNCKTAPNALRIGPGTESNACKSPSWLKPLLHLLLAVQSWGNYLTSQLQFVTFNWDDGSTSTIG